MLITTMYNEFCLLVHYNGTCVYLMYTMPKSLTITKWPMYNDSTPTTEQQTGSTPAINR